jgi:hypothetical protein
MQPLRRLGMVTDMMGKLAVWRIPYASYVLPDKEESFRLGIYIGGLHIWQLPNQESP